MPQELWVQQWEGIKDGCLQPLGYTLHSRREDIEQFHKARREKDTSLDRPYGHPYLAVIHNESMLQKLMSSAHGIWGEGQVPDPA